MVTKQMLPDAVIEAFHLMWNNFPEPVSLVHKSRVVIAINKAHAQLGILKPGMVCAKMGEKAAHKICQGSAALRLKTATYVPYFNPHTRKNAIAFWIPLDDYPEHFVHFGVGVIIDYSAVPAAWEPKKSVVEIIDADAPSCADGCTERCTGHALAEEEASGSR